MSISDQVTICITMGLRPDQLTRSLESLGPSLRALPTIAINDFGDQATNERFHALCPHGELVDLGARVGHMPAVDALYSRVRTPYILHLEDDWEFRRDDFLEQSIAVLNASPQITQVSLRAINDLGLRLETRKHIRREIHGGVAIKRLDGVDADWFGWTFNPHVARASTARELGSFSSFRGEKKVSIAMREAGRYCAFLNPGCCHHIGGQLSARKGQVARA